jgi:hypothetical protein
MFLSSRKYDPGCSHRNPDPDFYPPRVPDPGAKKAPDPGSGSATLTKGIGSKPKAVINDTVPYRTVPRVAPGHMLCNGSGKRNGLEHFKSLYPDSKAQNATRYTLQHSRYRMRLSISVLVRFEKFKYRTCLLGYLVLRCKKVSLSSYFFFLGKNHNI